MRISDWSSDVCSSDLRSVCCNRQSGGSAIRVSSSALRVAPLRAKSCRRRDMTEVPEFARRDASRNREECLALRHARPKELAISGGRHPARAGEMALMHDASAVGVTVGVKSEDDLHRLAPVGADRKSTRL